MVSHLQIAEQTNRSPEETTLVENQAADFLHRLMAPGFKRLLPEVDNQIDLLFGKPCTQWTAGWRENDLVVLAYHIDTKTWTVQVNGNPVLTHAERWRDGVTEKLNTLLEGDAYTTLTPVGLLSPLFESHRSEADLQQLAAHLAYAMRASLPLITLLKPILFELLEQPFETTHPDSSELLLIRTLSQKNRVRMVLERLQKMRVLTDLQDIRRLKKASRLMDRQFNASLSMVSPAWKPVFDTAYREFLTSPLARALPSETLHPRLKKTGALPAESVYEALVASILR